MKTVFFFIGTEAELMKMFTTIRKMQRKGYECLIVSSGQNDIKNSPFLKYANAKIDIDLSEYAPKRKGARAYVKWLWKTKKLGINVIKREVEKRNVNDCLWIVHGDTLSTLMGARIAMKVGVRYMHVESGPRSFSLLSPFPEEIDRYTASKHACVNFCPQKIYADYAAKRFKGKAVNTYYNTGIETLYFALDENRRMPFPRIIDDEYFVLAIHRQENLYNKKYIEQLTEYIEKLTQKIKCVFIYHVQTQNAMIKYGVWAKINANPNILVVERKPYREFIDIVDKAEFVIADGCGNQQEFYYMGKPYLIMRSRVERNSEGIGWNAMCFANDFANIDMFYDNYKEFEKTPIQLEISPSDIIVDEVEKYFEDGKLG